MWVVKEAPTKLALWGHTTSAIPPLPPAERKLGPSRGYPRLYHGSQINGLLCAHMPPARQGRGERGNKEGFPEAFVSARRVERVQNPEDQTGPPFPPAEHTITYRRIWTARPRRHSRWDWRS